MSVVLRLATGQCVEKDVRLTSYPTGEAQIWWQGAWRPMCYTWANDHTGHLICQSLGYAGGKIADRGGRTYLLNGPAVTIGGCEASDTNVTRCTGWSRNLPRLKLDNELCQQ